MPNWGRQGESEDNEHRKGHNEYVKNKNNRKRRKKLAK